MSAKKLFSRWLRPTIAVVLLVVMPQFTSARVENVVVVMPKGPRTLQMLGSISPQLLHTISDVLKPVPSDVVQIPVPYYPEYGNIPPITHPKHHPSKALHSAYFKSPFAHHVPPPTYSTVSSYNSHPPSFPNKLYYPFNFDFQSIQPGPYDTPFIPKLKPSPVNPLHIDNPPEIRFTPINLLPPAPPSFDTVRNYVQKLKAKQKEFFDTQGFEYGLFSQPNAKPSSFHRPVDQKKKQKYKHKSKQDELYSKHPNELSFIGDAHLNPHNDDGAYFSEPDSGSNYFYSNSDGHEFVIPPQPDDFKPIKLDGILDAEDAHFEQHGDQYLLKTKHPHAVAVTPDELDEFIQNVNENGFSNFLNKRSDSKSTAPTHHRNKRFKKSDRTGRASGDPDDEADFYDSDEGKKKFGELDFDDVEEEVRAHEIFEPKKTYTQVRHQETSKVQPKPEDEPRIKEKVIISRTNIVYSEKGKDDEHFDHGREESFGEFHSKSKQPKKHRRKRDLSEAEPFAAWNGIKTTDPVEHRSATSESEEDDSSQENELDYEYYPESEYLEDSNDTDTIYLPYAQALVFQNDTDMFLLPIPEALVDPRQLHGQDLLNFLDEAIKKFNGILPPDEKKMIKISPEIQSLQGQELIQFLDEAIKTSNQYLINGPADAIELVNPPRLGGESEPKVIPTESIKADHVFEYEMETPKPEDIHGQVLRYTQQQVLPDTPEYEVVNFVQPLKTLLSYHKDAPRDYEIEFESQDPRTLHGEDLLRYLDEAISNTTLYIPKEYEDSNKSTPYLKRAFHYVDVDTALKYADNITSEVSDYLNDRIKQNEVDPGTDGNNGFQPLRRAASTGENSAENGDAKQSNSNGQQKQSNPAVAVYNDVIRHIKNHMANSKKSNTKDQNVFMIAVPRSMRANLTRKAQRREDDNDDGPSHTKLFSLPIFDITQFYPTIFSKSEESRAQDEFRQDLEQQAERLVEKKNRKQANKDQSQHEQRLATRTHYRDDITDAFRDRSRYRGTPGFSSNSYDVKEKIRDYPQPTFKKPGPPYAALPLPPPISSKQKTSSLNAASSQRAVRHHPPPLSSLPHKRKRTQKRPRKPLKRIPSVVRTKVRIIKR